jgi:Ca2+-binding RTX toxin-like protein
VSHSLRRRARRALPLAAALLAFPVAADASTIQYDGGTVVFTGGPGGTYVDVTRADDGRISFQPGLDDQVTSLPDAGCSFVDLGEPVLCQASGVRVVMDEGDDKVRLYADLATNVLVDGGGGSDRLDGAYEGGDETLLGGPGNDGVYGGAGNDTVDGGDGDDNVKGDAGIDTVLGGAGTDKVGGDSDKGIEPDVVDGGAGFDTLDGDYSTVGREGRGGVTLTLGDGANDGFDGEGDDVRGVEKVTTSTGGTYTGTDAKDELYVGGEATTVNGRGGDDTIYTSYSADTIDGGAGADTIRGYDGDDRITGGPGTDTLIGDTLGQTCNVLTCSIYSGNDVIDARDGERDSIDCGLGGDQALVDAIDVHTNCEDVKVESAPAPGPAPQPQPQPAPRPQPKAGPRATVARKALRAALARGLTVRVAGAKPGKVKLVARRGRAKVAGCTVRVAGNGTGRCVLRFTKAGKRSLRRARSVTLSLSGGGIAQTLTLKR